MINSNKYFIPGGGFSSNFCVVGLGHMSIAKTLADVKFTFNPDLLHSAKIFVKQGLWW